MHWLALQEQGTGNSRAAIEVWEGSGQDAHDTVVHHLNLSVHRVETLQGNPLFMVCGVWCVLTCFFCMCANHAIGAADSVKEPLKLHFCQRVVLGPIFGHANIPT